MFRKFTRSRQDFPTTITRGDKKSNKKGHLNIGHKAAKKDVEDKIERQLHKDTIVRKCGGNWVFREPVGV